MEEEKDTSSDQKIELDGDDDEFDISSPFIEEEFIAESSEEFDIPEDEVQKDKEELEVEKLRRKVNTLSRIVEASPTATAFSNAIQSIFDVEVNFELAWNLQLTKLQYTMATNNSVVSVDINKLRSLSNDLQKIRKISTLVSLTRALGVPSLAEQLQDLLMVKEFGSEVERTKANDIFNKIEKLLNAYAEKIKDVKM